MRGFFSGPVIDRDVLAGRGVPAHYTSETPYFDVGEEPPLLHLGRGEVGRIEPVRRWRFYWDEARRGWLLGKGEGL